MSTHSRALSRDVDQGTGVMSSLQGSRSEDETLPQPTVYSLPHTARLVEARPLQLVEP